MLTVTRSHNITHTQAKKIRTWSNTKRGTTFYECDFVRSSQRFWFGCYFLSFEYTRNSSYFSNTNTNIKRMCSLTISSWYVSLAQRHTRRRQQQQQQQQRIFMERIHVHEFNHTQTRKPSERRNFSFVFFFQFDSFSNLNSGGHWYANQMRSLCKFGLGLCWKCLWMCAIGITSFRKMCVFVSLDCDFDWGRKS